MALADALGLVLAEDIRALHDLPPFDNAAMDGYALRAADVAAASPSSPATVQVVADLPAGTTLNPRLAPGDAARIMTGAPLPDDADTVVPMEQTAEGSAFPATGRVAVHQAAAPGAHVRRAGGERRAGDAVLTAGRLLGPLQLAAAAAAGCDVAVVHPAPRVAVFATGSELAPPGVPLARGQISESNSTLLSGLVTGAGGRVRHVGVVADEPAALRDAMGAVRASVDVIVLAGGVGSGAYDVVRYAFAAELDFEDVAMQPGRPQAFGRLPGGPLVFGLPGNPVAAAVSFEVFVRPALARLRGLAGERRTFEAVAQTGWASRHDRMQYLPVAIDNGVVRPAGAGRSHFVASLGSADGYAVVPVGVAEVRAGDLVTVLRATGCE